MSKKHPFWRLNPLVAATRDFWVTAHIAEIIDAGDYEYPPGLDTNEVASLIFQLPWNYHDISVLDLYVTPDPGDVAFDLDLTLIAGAEGEAWDQHSQSDLVSTYNLTAGVHNVIDLTAKLATVIGQLAAGDVVWLTVTNKEADKDLTVFGLHVRYT